MNKKLISLTLLAILAIGSLATVYGYHEYIITWEGVAHEHCGHSESNESETGTLELTISETGDLEPYQEFDVEIALSNFTEALEDPYYKKVLIGLPGVGEEGVDIDNHLFSSPLGVHEFNRRETVDDWGSYNEDSVLLTYGGDPSPDDVTFTLLAPAEAGTYTLMGLAICAVNQSSDFADTVEHADMKIAYVEGTIEITVVGSAGGSDDAIPGFITIVMLSSVGVTILAVVLAVRRKRKIV